MNLVERLFQDLERKWDYYAELKEEGRQRNTLFLPKLWADSREDLIDKYRSNLEAMFNKSLTQSGDSMDDETLRFIVNRYVERTQVDFKGPGYYDIYVRPRSSNDMNIYLWRIDFIINDLEGES